MAITSIVPYIHVADVTRSIAFYEMLGMECQSRFGPEGQPYWASMRSPGGRLMIAQASGPIDPRIQAVLFYLYTADLAAMREYLLSRGLADGGDFIGDRGQPQEMFPPGGIVFQIHHPPYLPLGEMRVHDPDGYVLQLATTVEETK